MLSLKILVAAMLAALSYEVPHLEQRDLPAASQAKVDKLRAGAAEMAKIYVDVAKPGRLVSPEADVALLASVGYSEGRWRPRPPDGDCWRNPATRKKSCQSFGPHQISTAAPSWLRRISPAWKTVTKLELRDPKRNVEASYELLAYYKRLCGGKPNIWLSAYTMGRCPKRYRNGNHRGRRRCELAVAIAKVTSKAFDCGHDPKHVDRKHRKVAALVLRRAAIRK